MNMNPEEALENFGLTNREAKVYLALLESGLVTAHEIAKKTKILRQTVYDILSSLIEKGLVSYFIKSGKKFFEAADPSKFKSILKEKEEIIDKILPKLESLKEFTKLKPKVEFYEGIEGLKTIYNDIIKNAETLYEYGNAENYVKTLRLHFIKNYIKKRVEAKIKLRLITEKDEKTEEVSKTDKKIFRETKSLEVMKEIQTINYIYANKFAILTLTKEPIGIIIENKEIAETQKKIFESLWGIAKRD